MSPWLLAAAALLCGLVPCGWVVAREQVMDRLVGLELAGVVTSLVLLLLAKGFGRSSMGDLAICLAVLSLAAGLTFAQNLERWL